MYSQFCTTLVTTTFLLFLLDKNNGERKKKGENKNTCEYERDGCFKSCQKVDVQISFLLIISIAQPLILSNTASCHLTYQLSAISYQIKPKSIKINTFNS